MNTERIKKQIPNTLALLALATLAYAFFTTSPYTNIIAASGLLFFFFAWLTANLLKPTNPQQKKVMIAMSLCVALGFSMLAYYEMQMPKYNIASIQKELYRVPPQLSKKQLIELGRECNSYGNTLCSHDVFAKIVRLDSRDFYALANLAMAQSHLGFHKFAIINFERALENGAKAYDIYKFYGNSLRVLKKYGKAVEAYNKSLQLNPNQDYLVKKIARIKNQTNN